MNLYINCCFYQYVFSVIEEIILLLNLQNSIWNDWQKEILKSSNSIEYFFSLFNLPPGLIDRN